MFIVRIANDAWFPDVRVQTSVYAELTFSSLRRGGNPETHGESKAKHHTLVEYVTDNLQRTIKRFIKDPPCRPTLTMLLRVTILSNRRQDKAKQAKHDIVYR